MFYGLEYLLFNLKKTYFFNLGKVNDRKTLLFYFFCTKLWLKKKENGLMPILKKRNKYFLLLKFAIIRIIKYILETIGQQLGKCVIYKLI